MVKKRQLAARLLNSEELIRTSAVVTVGIGIAVIKRRPGVIEKQGISEVTAIKAIKITPAHGVLCLCYPVQRAVRLNRTLPRSAASASKLPFGAFGAGIAN